MDPCSLVRRMCFLAWHAGEREHTQSLCKCAHIPVYGQEALLLQEALFLLKQSVAGTTSRPSDDGTFFHPLCCGGSCTKFVAVNNNMLKIVSLYSASHTNFFLFLLSVDASVSIGAICANIYTWRLLGE